MVLSVDLKGRVALVTGASSGLGRHFALVLARAGARVVIGARRADALQGVCEEIVQEGGQVRAIPLDVTDRISVEKAVEAAASDGGLDILVNNAGVTATTPLLSETAAEWDSILDTNLKGGFLVGQAAARAMAESKRGGSIVNVASILGLRVAGQVAAYSASKAALVQLTKSMALEWARYAIRANALCPGYVETDLNRDFFASEAGKALVKRIPYRRLGALADLEGPLLFLCSDASAYVTGTTLVVDGGHLVSSL